jgi:hypothetical protein
MKLLKHEPEHLVGCDVERFRPFSRAERAPVPEHGLPPCDSLVAGIVLHGAVVEARGAGDDGHEVSGGRRLRIQSALPVVRRLGQPQAPAVAAGMDIEEGVDVRFAAECMRRLDEPQAGSSFQEALSARVAELLVQDDDRGPLRAHRADEQSEHLVGRLHNIRVAGSAFSSGNERHPFAAPAAAGQVALEEGVVLDPVLMQRIAVEKLDQHQAG